MNTDDLTRMMLGMGVNYAMANHMKPALNKIYTHNNLPEPHRQAIDTITQMAMYNVGAEALGLSVLGVALPGNSSSGGSPAKSEVKIEELDSKGRPVKKGKRKKQKALPPPPPYQP